ncbi:MAG TPA: PAS domain S-box protein [Verrucomicrobiae bacterium]
MRFEKWLFGLGLLLIVLICAGGWFYYQYQATQAREAARESLSTIADLKADEISNWLKERLGDAEVARTSVIAKGIVSHPNNPEAREAALVRAEIFRRVYGYAAVVFAGAQGQIQLKVPADYPLPAAALSQHVQAALHSPKVRISDLNRDTTNGPILMWLECPIFDNFPTNNPPAGAVILVIDPHTFLYPTIKKWPTRSATAEAEIIRRDADTVVYLNDPRFLKDAALKLRVPIALNPHRPTVQAVQGVAGVVEGVDYRRQPVFWTARKIEGMPWFMVAMINKEEVLTSLHKEAWNVGIITALLMLASMLGIGLLWRQQKFAYVRTNEARFQTLVEQAPTAILISRDAKIIYVNRRFLDWYGYANLDEIIGRSITIHWAPEFRTTVAEHARRRAQGEPVPDEYEGLAQRKDGSQFPMHMAVTSVELPDGVAWLSFITDMTERKRAEEDIRRLNRLYAFLSSINVLIVHESNRQQMFETVCDIAVRIGKFRMAWIGLVDEAAQILKPVAAAGELNGYLDNINIDLTDPVRSSGISGQAAKTGEHQVCNDIEQEPLMEPWRAAARECGYLASTGFPLKLRGKIVGVFALYAAEKNFFDTGELKLLDELAGEISFALEMHQKEWERQRTEESLRETKEQIQYILNNTKDVIFQIDLQGNYIYGNTAAEQLTGYPLSQLLQMNMMQLIVPEYHALIRERLQQRIAGQTIEKSVEFEILHRDGRRIWTEQVTSEVRNRENQLIAIQGVARDITEKKQAEELLKRSEEKFSKAFQLSPHAMAFTDFASGAYIDVNDAFLGLFGYAREEVIGHSPFELKIIQDLATREQMLELLKVRGRVEELEVKVHNKQREPLVLLHNAEVIELGGRKCILGVSRDVTESRRLEGQLRQSQKMEAIGQLAGGVAHDFNNILAVIQMQADLLKFGKNLSPEQLELATEIGNATQRAAALTRQLLLFSRKGTAQKRDLDLNQTVNHMTRMLNRVISAEIQMQFKFAPAALLVHADAGMLDQVLLNLVVNARDAMPGGGKIIVEISGTEFDELGAANCPQARTGAFVCLSVSDTGTGISPEHLLKIFEPFFTTKEVGKGTGLGLATVFGIVEQHQGWINVYSEVGQGTTFRIYLPQIVQASEPPKAAPVSDTARGGRETILIVEDNTALRVAVQETLSQLGYQVLAAANGPEALLIWQKMRDNIDLLLTDLVMPGGLGGKELAARLLEDKPDLKVIYTSGYSAGIVGNDFPLHDGVNFLTKPFQALKLAQTIRDNLDKIPGASPAD